MKFFGVKANVFLNYSEGINSLCEKISEGLILPDFDIEHKENHPYEIEASCESLGFEIWIKDSNEFEGYPFQLILESELSTDEIFNDDMYDISPWLARFISSICNINTIFLNNERDNYIKIINGAVLDSSE